MNATQSSSLSDAYSLLRATFFRSPGIARLLVILLLVCIWEIGARLYNDPEFLAPASKTLIALLSLVQNVNVLKALGIMVIALVAGFTMAMISGAILGMIVGINRLSYLTFFPIILLIYAIPQVIFLPLFVLAFGVGLTVKICYGFTHGVFPIIVCVIAGTQNINPVLLRSAKSMGASKVQIYRRIVFPYMIPSLFTGMRLGMSATLIGVILAELYASQKGIGYYTRHYSETFEPDKLFALVILVSTAAISINELLRRAENHFSRWRIS